MLRGSYYRILLIAALTTLTAVLAHSQPLSVPINSVQQNASESLSNATMPVCYIQLENGQLRDLRRLCGKKSTNSASTRSGQRSVSQPAPDPDDDDSTATSTLKPQTVPLQPSLSTPSPQPTATRATPQPVISPLLSTPSRPAVTPPSPAPTIGTPSVPNPLAIPEENSRD